MDRTERFYKIEMLLRSRGSVSFAALREELAVSPATLKRDLQYLRDRLHAPIVYDAFDNGYRFDKGAPAGARHELPGMWFSEHEIHALLTMHQLLAGLDDDGVLARHLQPMLERLQGLIGNDAAESRELMRRIKVIVTARRPVPSRWFELLGSALVQRRRVWLRYFKRSDRRVSEREVSPQRLVHYRATWYLDAWCHASDGLRRFALDAVREAKLLETKAKNVPVRELEAALDAVRREAGGCVELAECTLDLDLPHGGRRDQHRVSRVLQCAAYNGRKPFRRCEGPQDHVGVEQELPHGRSPANAAATSAGNSSKSSWITTWPSHPPRTRGGVTGRNGTNLATGTL
jgi:predicted DNA-binding transcriptional regulator YafY